jgi:hypothetical protein
LKKHAETLDAPFEETFKRPREAVDVAFPVTLLDVTRVLIPYVKLIWASGYGSATVTSLKAVRGSLIHTLRDWFPFEPRISTVGLVPWV